MTPIEFSPNIPGFLASLEETSEAVDLRLAGMLQTQDSAELLGPELRKLHDQLIHGKVERIKVHFERVNYMNSGGIKAFASWFTRAHNGGASSYKIEVHYDPDSIWQGWSMLGLHRIAPTTVKLVTPLPVKDA